MKKFMRSALLLLLVWQSACASKITWPNTDDEGRVSNEAISMIRSRFESGVDALPEQDNVRIAIELALAAQSGADKRIAALTPPKSQVKLIDSNTILVMISFSRSIGYGTNYLQQFHVIERNWRGEWQHRNFYETVVLEMRK